MDTLDCPFHDEEIDAVFEAELAGGDDFEICPMIFDAAERAGYLV